MGGFFGVVSQDDCVADLYYGTDYHSHLGTVRGGMVVKDNGLFTRSIHDISNSPFRGKFEGDLKELHGRQGLGVISDTEDQPLIIRSHLGVYALVTVGRINNRDDLVAEAFDKRATHFAEMSGGEVNPTELVAALINRKRSFVEGIEYAQEQIDGSCSMLLLADDGIFAARDRFGRTPIVVAKKPGSMAVTLETCALPNLDFEVASYLGPGEIVRITADGQEQVKPPGTDSRVCAFLWVYYGYPASNYEGINTEGVRNRCGKALARADDVEVDVVAGIPDSGTGHAIGYAAEAGVPYCRPFVKYTPTWPRSFMPQEQRIRNLVAKMKLIPIEELIRDRRLLFCEDSIVRGTQLRDTIQRIYDAKAKEIHMRPACPPLVFGCKFLNFSRSRSELVLAARQAVQHLEGDPDAHLDEYADASTARHAAMVEQIRDKLNLTTLKYQKLDDLIAAIGLPADNVCTYCWNGCEGRNTR